MKTSKRVFPPGREDFAKDPLGYSSLAHLKWAVACERAGYSIDPAAPATSEHLKNPILWLSQANAMSQAAYAVLMTEQGFESMPLSIRASSETSLVSIARRTMSESTTSLLHPKSSVRSAHIAMPLVIRLSTGWTSPGINSVLRSYLSSKKEASIT